MITYTVYEPPDAPADRLDRAETHVFVKEGFSWLAAVFSPFWMIANKLWLVLVFYLSALAIFQAMIWSFGIDQNVLSPLVSALHVLIGYESSSLIRWTLNRKGWHHVGTVNGRNIGECERRFFDDWLPLQPIIRPETLGASALAAEGISGPLTNRSAGAAGSWRSPFAFGRNR